MSRIAIGTLHASYNEGAVMQAWCLSQFLGARILDQEYPHRSLHYGPAETPRQSAIQQFVRRKLSFTTAGKFGGDCRPVWDHLNHCCDGYVVGSDEVWKFDSNRLALPVPSVYLPDESVHIPRVAYAASIGSSRWYKLSAAEKDCFRESLSRFSLIGVRDRRTLKFLHRLSPELGQIAELVPDPCFSYDFSHAYEMARERFRLPPGRRLAVMIDKVRVRPPRGYHVVSLYDPALAISPLEWFGIIGIADWAATRRMHGLIACVLGNTPCVSVDRRAKSRELRHDFRIPRWNVCANWPTDFIQRKRQELLQRHREFAERVQNLCRPATGEIHRNESRANGGCSAHSPDSGGGDRYRAVA